MGLSIGYPSLRDRQKKSLDFLLKLRASSLKSCTHRAIRWCTSPSVSSTPSTARTEAARISARCFSNSRGQIIPTEISIYEDLGQEALARFRNEARTLASLQHPNVASIYGLEEVGDAVVYLSAESGQWVTGQVLGVCGGMSTAQGDDFEEVNRMTYGDEVMDSVMGKG